MIITDLDGTLLDSNHSLSEVNRNKLVELGEKGITRVIATGRVLFSVQNVLDEDCPIDYLIFSSGAGIIDFNRMELIFERSMNESSLLNAIKFIQKENLNFMIHAPVPENHFCHYFSTEKNINDDFKRRLDIYEDFSTPWSGSLASTPDWENSASLIIVIVEKQKGEATYNKIKNQLKNLHVVRTTSPLDSNYNWIEILPENVSKAKAAQWLKEKINYESLVMGIGNDYNDLDLLTWTDHSYVVSNAPDLLKSSYQVVDSNDENGFSCAVEDFISKHY